MIGGFPFFVKVGPTVYSGKPEWSAGREYPVLAVEDIPRGGNTRVLLADDNGRLAWIYPGNYSVVVIVHPPLPSTEKPIEPGS